MRFDNVYVSDNDLKDEKAKDRGSVIYDLDVDSTDVANEMGPSIRNVASDKRDVTGRQAKRLKSRRAGYSTATWKSFDQKHIDFR